MLNLHYYVWLTHTVLLPFLLMISSFAIVGANREISLQVGIVIQVYDLRTCIYKMLVKNFVSVCLRTGNAIYCQLSKTATL